MGEGRWDWRSSGRRRDAGGVERVVEVDCRRRAPRE